MRQLLYTSKAVAGIVERDVRMIVGASQYRNSLDRITGILLFDGLRFMQFIEGSDVAVSSLMDRLYADVRHREVIVMHDAAAERRSFPIWSMRWVHLDNAHDARRHTITRMVPGTIDPGVRDQFYGFVAPG
ncbi:BLUF domain-containing protein [Croceicoccus ponticola]|uniref:BLUF domain-containing protein n=1 Tax=Croceicoccus ponticola TaxID=2217664 RepID=UPI0013E325ED|nr:BLUF domain-containing protein [Croceicoccus ponticola]